MVEVVPKAVAEILRNGDDVGLTGVSMYDKVGYSGGGGWASGRTGCAVLCYVRRLVGSVGEQYIRARWARFV